MRKELPNQIREPLFSLPAVCRILDQGSEREESAERLDPVREHGGVSPQGADRPTLGSPGIVLGPFDGSQLLFYVGQGFPPPVL
jgi:hypothetical protein